MKFKIGDYVVDDKYHENKSIPVSVEVIREIRETTFITTYLDDFEYPYSSEYPIINYRYATEEEIAADIAGRLNP